MVCAAGWGRIFTTGLTIMGLHFYKSYQSGVAHFQDFGGQKIKVYRDLKIERFKRFNKCVSSFQDDRVIRQMHKQKVTQLGLRKLLFFPKVTKMGSIIWPQIRIDYNGVGGLRGQRHIREKSQKGRKRHSTFIPEATGSKSQECY